MCKSWCELILAIVIIVFALWQTAASQWIELIAGIVLLIHSFTCKQCFAGRELAVAKPTRRRR